MQLLGTVFTLKYSPHVLKSNHHILHSVFANEPAVHRVELHRVIGTEFVNHAEIWVGKELFPITCYNEPVALLLGQTRHRGWNKWRYLV